MKKFLPPIILASLGLGLGAAAGHLLKPAAPAPEAEVEGDGGAGAAAPALVSTHVPAATPGTGEYVKLDKQFIVPVVIDDRVDSLIVISMALEVSSGQTETVFLHEPKLRDEFLRVLFLHAQSGGFSGAFTESHVMNDLRGALTASAQAILGDIAHSVLLTSVVRQDL